MKADSGVTYSDLTWIVYNSRAQTPAEVSQSRESPVSVREASQPNYIKHPGQTFTSQLLLTSTVLNVGEPALRKMENRILVFLLLFAISAVKVGRLKIQGRHFYLKRKYFRPRVTTLNVMINPAFCVWPEITQHSIFPSDKSLIK